MKNKAIYVVWILWLASAIQGQDHGKNGKKSPGGEESTKDSRIEASLLKMTEEWVLAEDHRDETALRRLVANDFVGTSRDGTRLTKDKLLASLGSRNGEWSFTAADFTTRIFGDLGVVTGNGTWKDANLGQLSFTLVYKKRAQSWQIINLHLSKIPE
jgi:hypothetical protein